VILNSSDLKSVTTVDNGQSVAGEIVSSDPQERRAKISNQFFEKLRYKISVGLC
jgi:hypothetical protein